MKKRIEILHIITRMEEGGAPRVLLDLIGGLDPARFAQTLAVGPAPEGTDLLPRARRLPIEIREVGALTRRVSPVRDLAALVSLIDLIKRGRFDIIHVHTSKAGFLGRLAARIAGRTGVIYSPHGDVFAGYFSGYETAAYALAERLAARWCEKIVTLTDAGAREYLARGIGTERQFVTIPNGVDAAALLAAADRLGVRRELGIGKDEAVIVCVGRLVFVKGYDLMVEAAPRIITEAGSGKGVRFLMVGDGPEKEHLLSRARALGVRDRFLFVGFRDDVGRLLSGADLLAMPSRNEGLGMSILEAMALKLPVVASRVGGIPDVVRDAVTGIIVAPGDPGGLARGCIELISDVKRAASMGREGERLVRERFGIDRFVEGTEKLYRDVMGDMS